MVSHPPVDDLVEASLKRRGALHILLADDDLEMRALLSTELRRDGYDVLEMRNGIELVRAIHRFESARVPLHLIITDVRMPGFTGFEVLEYLRAARLSVPVILMSGFGDDRLRADARGLDAALVLDKPFAVDDLRAAVARIVPRPAG